MALKMHHGTQPKTTANRGPGGGRIPTTKASAKPKAPALSPPQDPEAATPPAPSAGDTPAR